MLPDPIHGAAAAPHLPLPDWPLADLATQARWARAAGNPWQALDFLNEALRRQPGHPGILADMALCHLDARDPETGGELLRVARRAVAGHPGVLEQLGQKFLDEHYLEHALEIFSELGMAATPGARAVGNARAAVVLWRLGRQVDAMARLAAATADGASLPEVMLARALLCKDDEPIQARHLLAELTDNPAQAPPAFVAAAAHTLAGVHDQLGDCDAAMAALAWGKRIELDDPRIAGYRGSRATWRAWHRRPLAMAPAATTEDPSVSAGAGFPPHALLLGHPRSGTTLLEQMLDAHPMIRGVEERTIYEATIGTTLQHGHGIPGEATPSARTTGQAAIQQARSRYFDGLRHAAGNPPDGCLILDKNPALTMALPWIARVLPQARLIIALRDPRDVCLSAYFQSCQRTAWSSNWLTLGETVEQYAFAMGIWLEMRENLNQPWIEIRYEDVVATPVDEGRRLTRFLGLEWHPAQASPAEHARGKIIRSPSHAEVLRPIHPNAIGRWRRYHTHLAPHLPVLRPFVAAFGYADRAG